MLVKCIDPGCAVFFGSVGPYPKLSAARYFLTVCGEVGYSLGKALCVDGF